MMQIYKQKSKQKYIYLAVATALLIIAGVAYFLYAQDDSKSNTKAQSDVDQATKLAEKPANKSISPNSDQPSEPTSSEASDKKTVQMVASANISNGTVYIRGGLNYPEPEAGGSCYAELTNSDGDVTRKDTQILQNPASADCKTISVPASELSPGSWKIVLNYTSANYEGSSNEVEISIS